MTLILTEPVPVVFEFVPLIGQNFFLWSISEEVHPGDSAAFYTKCSSALEDTASSCLAFPDLRGCLLNCSYVSSTEIQNESL